MKSNRQILLAGLLLGCAALAAYHNTFAGPFTFDDRPSILENPTITRWATALSPPKEFGFTVSGRPLLNLTLAANYAISGTHVWSYHVLNLLIHLLAGLTLFGLVRRTLQRPVLAGRFGELALPTAFVTALLWIVHPLQTESVTYVIQRAESLMGLFFLLTLYGFVRAVEAPTVKAWRVVAVGACLLGVMVKEVMALAPVVVLLYDRTFVAGSWRGAWQQRRGLHLLLFATWLPLAWLVLSTGGDRGGTFTFSVGAMGNYWLTQFEAVSRYLQLSFWPAPLVFEYGFRKVDRVAEVAPFALLVGSLGVATLWSLVKRPVVGFLGACFFLILAPTSLMPGVQMIVEHRMYLPLAAVLALVVGGGVRWLGRWALVGFALLAVVAGGLTVRRNAVYATEQDLWTDTVAKSPLSSRAQGSLGMVYFSRGDLPKALSCFEESLRLDPNHPRLYYNLGITLAALDRPKEAVPYFEEAVRRLPKFGQAHGALAALQVKLGRVDEALEHLKAAISYMPPVAEVQYTLGLALTEKGQLPGAVAAYEAALGLRPDYAEAECNLGVALYRLIRIPEALSHLERALKLDPKLADAHYNLGLVLEAGGRADDALAHYAEAVQLNPTHAEARLNFGVGLAQRGRFREALEQLNKAVELQPGLTEAHANLGIVLVELGRVAEAVGSYETALRLRPDYAKAHYNLGNALVQQQRWSEAKQHFAEAVRLAPDFAAAREMVERLQAVP